MVCRCETITKAEVLHAIGGPLGARTVTGVKYRCRAMMGRCQGGYCQTRITELLMREKGIPPEELTLWTARFLYFYGGGARMLKKIHKQAVIIGGGPGGLARRGGIEEKGDTGYPDYREGALPGRNPPAVHPRWFLA